MNRFAWFPRWLISNGKTGSYRYLSWLTSYWRAADGTAYHCLICDPVERKNLINTA